MSDVIDIFGKLKPVSTDNILTETKYIHDSLMNDSQENINKKIFTEVTNIADDEDLTKIYNPEKGQEVLQLKDRQYVQGSNNGMGYVILRQNKSFKEQVTKANTIYEIRYDFNLGGEEVEIPENCVLKFEGGSLRNGGIKGSSTKIDASVYAIFNNVYLTGTYNNNESYPEWFGCVGKVGVDDSDAMSRCLHSPIKRVRFLKAYWISKPITYSGNKHLYSQGYPISSWSGLIANPDFSTIDIDGVTIDALLYTNDHSPITITNIYFRGEYIAGSGIVSLGYATYEIKKCGFQKFHKSGVEIPSGDSSILEECTFTWCRVAVMVSSYNIDYENPLNNNLTYKQSPNHIRVSDCSTTFCTFGFILKGCSNVIITNNLFGYNSLQSIYLYAVSNAVVNNNYFEGEFSCKDLIYKGRENNPVQDKSNAFNSDLKDIYKIDKLFTADTLRAYVNFIQCGTCTFKGSHVSNWYLRTYRNGGHDNYTTTDIAGCDSTILVTGKTRLYMEVPKHSEWFAIDDIKHLHLYDVVTNSSDDASIYCQSDYMFRNYASAPVYLTEPDIHNSSASHALEEMGEGYINPTNNSVLNFKFHRYHTLSLVNEGTKYFSTSENITYGGVYFDSNRISSEKTYRVAFKIFVKETFTGAPGFICRGLINGSTVQKAVYKSSTFNANTTYFISYYFTTEEFLGSTLMSFMPTISNNSLIDKFYVSKIEVSELGLNYKSSYDFPKDGQFSNTPKLGSLLIGTNYFCTDKQTTEGASDGIMIYHKGNDVWVDALGRVIS